MSYRFKQAIKFRIYTPVRYFTDLIRTRVISTFSRKESLTSHLASLRVLLISDNKSYTSEQQLSPFFAYRRSLRREFGLVLNHRLVRDTINLPASFFKDYQLIFIKLFFQTPTNEAENIVRKLYQMKGNAKLVYFDGDDDSCIQWPEVLRYVDLYVKRHIFRDLSKYQQIFTGKTNLTDYVAHHWGVSFADNIIPNSKSVDPVDLDKIFLGWTFGWDDKIRNLYLQNLEYQPTLKDNDIVCRATIPNSWMYYLRKDVVAKLQEMAVRYKVLASTEAVVQKKYYDELRRSKICVSPFGHGEICYRDFEAVLCKCLLIKPDMSHINTYPNIFIPGETYIPVKWDFSDLEDKCNYYLGQENERQRIAEQAYKVLADSYSNERFFIRFEDMLKKLDR